MTASMYDRICYRTEQQDELVALRNLRTGQLGIACGCTYAGETVQVQLTDGQLDSWGRDECTENFMEPL